MRVVFTFPDATQWPPSQYGCFAGQIFGQNAAQWIAADTIRITDPGNGFNLGMKPTCRDLLPASRTFDLGLTFKGSAPGAGCQLGMQYIDFVNGGLSFQGGVQMGGYLFSLQINDNIGGLVNANPVINPGDAIIFRMTWAAGNWTSQIFVNGVLQLTLVTAAALDPVGETMAIGFGTDSAGGGGRPANHSDFGDLAWYLHGPQPQKPFGFQSAGLGGSLRDEAIEGDV